VYRNLHTGGYSIQDTKTGLVIAHRDEVALTDVVFVVRHAGRAKVLRERRKNVHAFAVGRWRKGRITDLKDRCAMSVHYNPYEAAYFQSRQKRPIYAASAAILDQTGLRIEPLMQNRKDK